MRTRNSTRSALFTHDPFPFLLRLPCPEGHYGLLSILGGRVCGLRHFLPSPCCGHVASCNIFCGYRVVTHRSASRRAPLAKVFLRDRSAILHVILHPIISRALQLICVTNRVASGFRLTPHQDRKAPYSAEPAVIKPRWHAREPPAKLPSADPNSTLALA